MQSLPKLPLGHGLTVQEHDNGSPLFGGHVDACLVESHGEQIAQQSARNSGQVSQGLIVVIRKRHSLVVYTTMPCGVKHFYAAAKRPTCPVSCPGNFLEIESRESGYSENPCNPGHRAYLGRVPILLGATLLLSQIGLTKIDNWQILP